MTEEIKLFFHNYLSYVSKSSDPSTPVRRRTRDQKVGRGAIKTTKSTQLSIPPG